MRIFRAFRTRDEAAPIHGSFFATEQIGPKMFLTPEGFLVCQEVPIARTGSQIYGPGQCPIAPGPDGIVLVHRTAEQVFAADTMASANGKDVCDDHPEDDVMPFNYRILTCGCLFNIRRGEGVDDELLLADLMIKEPQLIAAVLSKKKREVSLGYTADYVQTGPGLGEQRKIRINHVAVVDKGRCGPRCSIADHAHDHVPTPETKPTPTPEGCGCHTKETQDMKPSLKSRVLDALKGKVRDEDMPAIGEAMDKAKDAEGGEGAGEVHIHMPAGANDGNFVTKDAFDAHCAAMKTTHDAMGGRLEALEAAMKDKPKTEGDDPEKDNEPVKDELAEEAPEGKATEAVKARDSAYLEASFTDTLAAADILVPGITPPLTFDRAMKPAKTYKDGICALRAKTLDAFYGTEPGKAYIDGVMNGRAFSPKTMACARVADLFHGAVAHKKAINNGQVGDLSLATGSMKADVPHGSTMAMSAEDLAKQAASAWA